MFRPERHEVIALIAAAVRAPSADNQHHVRFAIDDDALTLQVDSAFRECTERHRRLLMLLSFGAVVENLALRIGERGASFSRAWFPDGDTASCLLRIEWAALAATDARDPLASAIESRHTNRRFFKGPRLPAESLQALDAAATTDRNVQLAWFDAPDRRRAALRLMRIAETARFGNRTLHEELFESIDFDAGWKGGTAIRLAPSTLEVEPFLRLPFRAMRHWNVMRVASAVGAHHLLGLRAGDVPARTSPHIGVLSFIDGGERGALAVGAAFQRLWLAADTMGLALQPMVASTILAAQSQSDDAGRNTLRDTLRDGWRTLLGDRFPLVAFRLGRARRPAFVSGRMPVEHYLLPGR